MVAPVEGIEGTFQSLLSRQSSRREEEKKFLERQAQQNLGSKILDKGVQFLQRVLADKHQDFLRAEDTKAVSRFIKRQNDVLKKRQEYEDAWKESGKTQLEYEYGLVEKALPEAEIIKYIPGWNEFKPDDQSQILYGTGASDSTGIYGKLAANRVAARKQFKTDLGTLKDSDEFAKAWKKLNPTSRSVLGQALNMLKNNLNFGSTTAVKANLRQIKFDEIKENSVALEEFYAARASGFSPEEAINAVTAKIKSGTYERVGEVLERQIVSENRRVVAEDGSVIQVPISYVIEMRQINGEAVATKKPISAETVNPETGENFTAKDVEYSQQAVNDAIPVSEIVDRTDPDTGITVKFRVLKKIDPTTGKIVGTPTETVINPDAQKIVDNPGVGDFTPAAKAAGWQSLERYWPQIETFGNEGDKGFKQEFVLTQPSDSQQYQTAMSNLGVNVAVIKNKLEDSLDTLNLARNSREIIASQLLMMDRYARKELGSAILGNSTDRIEDIKLFIAMDLAQAKGYRFKDSNNEVLNTDELLQKFNDVQFFEGAGFQDNANTFLKASEISLLKQMMARASANADRKGDRFPLSESILSVAEKDENGEIVVTKKSIFELISETPLPPEGVDSLLITDNKRETAGQTFNRIKAWVTGDSKKPPEEIRTNKTSTRGAKVTSEKQSLVERPRIEEEQIDSDSMLSPKQVAYKNLYSPGLLQPMGESIGETVEDFKRYRLNNLIEAGWSTANIKEIGFTEEEIQTVRDSLLTPPALSLVNPNVAGLNPIVEESVLNYPNITANLVLGVIDIETEEFSTLAGKATADSGHDAHGPMQVKTSTAVQPGYGAKTVFDVADELNISYDPQLKDDAIAQTTANFKAGAIKDVTGKAGDEVIRLLQIPEVNIELGTNLLSIYSDRYEGDIEKILVAFNQGASEGDTFTGDRSKIPSEGKVYLERAKQRNIF